MLTAVTLKRGKSSVVKHSNADRGDHGLNPDVPYYFCLNYNEIFLFTYFRKHNPSSIKKIFALRLKVYKSPNSSRISHGM